MLVLVSQVVLSLINSFKVTKSSLKRFCQRASRSPIIFIQNRLYTMWEVLAVVSVVILAAFLQMLISRVPRGESTHLIANLLAKDLICFCA